MSKKNVLLKGHQASKRATKRATKFCTSFSLEAKMEALRKKTKILNKPTKTVSEPQLMTELRAQFKNRNFTGYNPYKAFIKSRCTKVQNVCEDATPLRRSVIWITTDQFLNERRHWVQPTFPYSYRTCNRNKVIANDVKIFPNNLRKSTKPTLLPTSPSKKQLRLKLVRSKTEKKNVPKKKKK